MSNSVIPFGKHKGEQVLEVLEKDPQYIDWLRMQPGIQEKYPGLFQVIINYGNEPSETPEHNALQARLLDEDFQRGFFNTILAPNGIAYLEDRLAAGVPPPQMDLDPAPKFAISFEVDGADARVVVHYKDWYWLDEKMAKEQLRAPGWHVWSSEARFLIEFKPLIGEDYPAVLRQIKAFRACTSDGTKKLLVYGHFDVRSVSLEKVKAIFATADILLYSADELTA